MVVNSLSLRLARFMGQEHSEYRKMWLLAISAFVLSAAVIAYYNFKMYPEQIADVYSQVELMAITFMPYMISAVVSTLTAIAIMTMLPMVRSQPASLRIRNRLVQLGQGDLTADTRVECGNHFLMFRCVYHKAVLADAQTCLLGYSGIFLYVGRLHEMFRIGRKNLYHCRLR